MGLILNIDTSGQEGVVSLSKDGLCINSLINNEPMQHAAFLQPAIQELMLKSGFTLKEVDAVSVSNGPGSYTGLRVGLASAKGLCYALKKPLICINSLQAMALAAQEKAIETILKVNNWQTVNSNLPLLFCPMIDARRMEVFFAVYEKGLQEIVAPSATILDANFLAVFLSNNCIYFSGNGVLKWKKLCNHSNAIFFDSVPVTKALSVLAERAFQENSFADITMAEPFYYKEFYSTAHN